MESDRQCPCAAGFLELADNVDCIKQVYDLCKEGTSRAQNGQCLTDEQWIDYCTNSVCSEYVSFDRRIGMCLCKTEDLEELCNLECRLAQRTRIAFVCAEPPLETHIVIRDANNNIVKEYAASSLLKIVNARESVTSDQCTAQDGSEYPINIVEMSSIGFLGVYEPDPTQLTSMLDSNVKGNITGNITQDSNVNNIYTGRRRLLATSVNNGSLFSGIENPVVCVENGDFMLFSVSSSHYPVYDVNNLFNTNSNFDYGGFRALIEALTQTTTSTTLFSYQWNDPGVYVFYLSTDSNKRMYIRVMAAGAQCSESGPFFPPTSGYIIQNGITVASDILKTPDWEIIFILLGVAFLSMVIMLLALILFRKYGWSKTSYLFPFYRTVTRLYNFDDYSSKGSSVHGVKKYHRNIRGAISGRSESDSDVAAILDADTIETKEDEFWDYDRQVELEAFNTRTLYDTLSKQSRAVTQTIGKQKDEVKQMYNRIANQNESLRGLWAAKMNLKGKAAMATNEDLASYESKLEALEIELERRRDVGRRFEAILQKQKEFMADDEKGRENHQVTYQACLREAQRTLVEHAEKMRQGELNKNGEFDHEAHRSVNSRSSVLLQKMSSEITDECQRIGAYGVLGQGTGGQLVKPGRNGPMKREDIIGSDMSVKASDLVTMDTNTGLIRPKAGSKMILADGTIKEVPSDYFLHPQTGHVLPVEGNVAFDPVTSRLVFVVDSATGEAARSDEPFIPFVPYPISPQTKQPIKTKLRPMEHKSDLKYGAPMTDPETGLHVPIMAVTIHPSTGAILPIGSTHIDPVTGMPTPIEIGSLMIDPISEQPVPILAVTLDPESGDVVPVGGTKPGSKLNIPIIPGDSYVDKDSGKLVRVHGGFLRDTTVLPSGGGFQALLDSSMLACEARVIDTLRELKDALADGNGPNVNVRHEESNLESAVKELDKARIRMKSHLLRSQQDVERRLDRASILAATGGCPGMYEFSKTGQLLPILVGTTMQDPAGTGQEVPILGAERDKKTGNVKPLGGTMEDPEGAGLVPIAIGRKAVDLVTGEISPVIGVRSNPDNGMALPITLSSGGPRKKKPPPGALAMLEEELVARRGFWRRQRSKEKEITLKEHQFAQKLLFDVESVTSSSVQKFLDEIDSDVHQLSEAEKREVQRRGGAEQEYATILPPEVIAVLTDGDAKEAEAEEAHVAQHVRFCDMLRRFFNKLQQEEKLYKDRISDLQGAMNPDAENTTMQRYKQAKLRLQAELKEQLIVRMETLDQAHSPLEYAREKSEMCAVESKLVLTHAALLAGDYDAQLSGVYGDIASSGEQDSELIPLLKQLIAMLESGGPFYLSSELLNLIKQASGGAGGQHVTNINLGDGRHGKEGRGRGDGEDGGSHRDKRAKSQLVKSSIKTVGTSGTQPDDSLFGGQKGKGQGGQSSELSRALFEKQAYEAAKLEHDLKKSEIDDMNNTVEGCEKEKEKGLEDAKSELERKLSKCKTEEERDRLMMDYVVNMQKLNEAFEKRKRKQLDKLRKRLLDARRQRKKELHNKHVEEAKGQGLQPDAVPNINMPSYEDLMNDLVKLQQQQEQMMAEMRKNSGEARSQVKQPDLDTEFEQQVRGLDLTKQQKDALVNSAREKQQELRRQIEEMKEKLKNRKDRKKVGELTEEEMQEMSEEDKRKMLEARGLQAEADREMEDEAVLETLKAMEQDQKKKAEEQALKEMLKNMSKSEQEKIMRQYEEQLQKLNSRLDEEKAAQGDKVKAKLAAKKRMREELEKERAVNKELDNITKSQAAKGDADAAELIMQINEKVNGDKMSADQQKLVDEQLRQQEKLEEEQKTELRKVNHDANEEMWSEKNEIDETIKQQKNLALQAHQSKFERDMLLHHDKLTPADAEYQQLLAAHKAEMESLERNLDQEKARQHNALKEKIAAKKKRRAEQLEDKHRVEMEQKLSEQQQERDKLNEQIAKKEESSALKKTVKNKNKDEAENMIYSVLRQRHLKEAIHLEDQLQRELDAARRRARAEIEEKRQKERDSLLAAFEQEMRDLIADSADLDPQELERRKAQLRKQQESQLKEFDDLTNQMLTRAEQEVTPQQQINQTHQRLQLKEKQLQELADAMKSYSPTEELYKQYEEQARLAAEEARKYQEDVVRKMQEELEKRKEEQKRLEEERKRKLLEEFKRKEAELEEEHRREEQRQKDREAERERLRQQQLEDQDKRQRNEISKSGASQEEKERLLREHAENMEKLRSNMDEDHKRSKDALQSKLAARRKRKMESEKAKLEKNLQMEVDAERKNQLTGEKVQGFGDNEASGPGASGIGMGLPSGSSTGGFTPSGNPEQDWVNMLMASPLFKQINDLAQMLDSSDMGGLGSSDRVLGADYNRPYMDVKDAQWVCKGDLVPCDINSITPSQFVIYRFGVFIVRLLHQTIRTPDISLLLASNLPANNYERNAFRNSVFYEHARKVLFVRKERMDSMGEFVVVILHSLAHIKVGDLTDDSNTLFLREFYKALRVVCQDMFFSRTHNTPSAQAMIGSDSANCRTALEQALGSVKKQDEKMVVVGELVDMKVDGPTRLDFSEQRMSQRLYGYESLASNARLRQFLSSNGGFLATSDFVNNRMSELRGLKSPTVSPRSSPRKQQKVVPNIKTPRDVADMQLMTLEAKNDQLNAELTEVLKAAAELQDGIQQMEKADTKDSRLSSAQDQLVQVLTRKDDLLKRIATAEADIAKKEKELKIKRK